MKKTLIRIAVAGALLAPFAFAVPAVAAAPNWDVSGSWVFDYHDTTANLHDMTLAQDGAGLLTGSGGAFHGDVSYTYPWTIDSGSVSGDSITFTAHYTATVSCSFTATGTIAPDGTMAGTWTDNCFGERAGTWATTVGIATAIPQAPTTVTVTINKFIGTAPATAATANSSAFPMSATWNATNIGAGTGSYDLDADGFNGNPTPYQAITSDMTVGADYSTYEVTGGSVVGATCADGKPYALVGYTSGDTLVAAAGATPTLTVPSFTGLTSDKYVIVWNKVCVPTPSLVSPPDGSFTTTALQQIADWSDVSDPFMPMNYVYQSSHSSATNPDGSFASPAYTSGLLSASQIPTPGTPAGTYYWHVKAVDNDGNESSWSTMWKFVVSNTALSLTQSNAYDSTTSYNLPGTSHTATADIGQALAGVNVLFVVTGANAQTGTAATNSSGKASFTYTGSNSGTDTIVSCVDFNSNGGCDAGELTSNMLTKYWLTQFVSGGGNIKVEKAVRWTFGGAVGLDASSHQVGSYELSDKANKVNYHFDTFSNIVFTPDHKTVSFDASGVTQGKTKTPVTAHFSITDNGEPGKADTLFVTGGVSVTGNPISGGNFQVFVQ